MVSAASGERPEEASEPTVTPLAGLIGAEVDVDLRSLDDGTFDRIHRAFLEHVILVFPNQQLAADDQLAFARRFGDLYRYPHAPGISGHDLVLPINLPSGVRRGRWHSDATFEERPPAISILCARELPSRGGETAFANQYAAYEALSAGMKQLLASMEAVHDAFSHNRPNEWTTHPVLRTHPETGRTALFVNSEFTRRFRDMTAEESEGLLGFLTNHAPPPGVLLRPPLATRRRGDVGQPRRPALPGAEPARRRGPQDVARHGGRRPAPLRRGLGRRWDDPSFPPLTDAAPINPSIRHEPANWILLWVDRLLQAHGNVHDQCTRRLSKVDWVARISVHAVGPEDMFPSRIGVRNQ